MLIKRHLLHSLQQHLAQPEITLLVGPRQSGKTTLLHLLREQLADSGAPALFLNLDIEKDAIFFSSQEKLIRHIRATVGERRAYVFIDEIQRKENAGLFLKGLYDSRLPYKFIVSGSGSLELKEKIKESLVGRKRIFELGPVNIEEFIAHRTGYQFEERLGEWVRLAPAELEPLLLEYLNFGGYPRVILADNYAEKAEVLEEILGSYLDRDIRILLQLEKSHAFSLMLRLAGAFRHLPEMGAVFENFIFQILHNWYATIVNPVKYWRTKDKAEVDFVVEKGLHPLPVEAKCQSLRKPTISRSFRNFINTYAPEEAWVVNPDYHNEIRLGNTLVRFRPWYDLVWHNEEM